MNKYYENCLQMTTKYRSHKVNMLSALVFLYFILEFIFNLSWGGVGRLPFSLTLVYQYFIIAFQ